MRVPRQKAEGLLRTLASDHVSALRNTGRGGYDIVLTNKNTSHMDFSDLSVFRCS
jgi:hypothetical protein